MAGLRQLARQFDALEVMSTTKKTLVQEFQYLIVLDFEATCWEGKVRKPQNEIIEFAAVLLDVHKGKILDQFQMYVKPTENPQLSEFCIELTSIKQSTVNESLQLDSVLLLFDDWVKCVGKEYGFSFPKFSQPKARRKCAFATWSDWDLGTCLKKECRRKSLNRESYFNQWIDIRQLYIDLYKDRPMGLLGALNSLKMDFIGQQHCGLDDAKNTAYLVNQMVEDGVVLHITKIL